MKESVVMDGQDGCFSDVCFEGTRPKYSIQQHIVFLFNPAKDNSTPRKMSDTLRYLKGHIKAQYSGSKPGMAKF